MKQANGSDMYFLFIKMIKQIKGTISSGVFSSKCTEID